jgi:CheY-like chemotaxis protein
MSADSEWIDILLAADNDCFHEALQKELKSEGVPVRIHSVNGQEALVQLLVNPNQVSLEDFRPRLVILEIEKGNEAGLQFLSERSERPEIRKIPVVVVTPEQEDEWISKIYGLGVTSVVGKPDASDQLSQVLQALKDYWLGIVKLPSPL